MPWGRRPTVASQTRDHRPAPHGTPPAARGDPLRDPGAPPPPARQFPHPGTARERNTPRLRLPRISDSGNLCIELIYSIEYTVNMQYHRVQLSTLQARLREAPDRIIALFGPRQTGKSTLARAALRPTDHYLAVDEPEPARIGFMDADFDERGREIRTPQTHDTDWLVRNWKRARRDAERLPQGCVLAIDEIQKIPKWSETVKGLWDADRARSCPLHVVILGSAPLLMQSGLSESLTGRFEPIRVPHWSFAEMATAFSFDLATYLYFGGYPGAGSLARDEVRWRDYVLGSIIEPTVERDLLALTRVDKPVLLKRLVELASAHSGEILSYTKMLGQLCDAGNTTTLARYLDLLNSAGLVAGLPKYAENAVRQAQIKPEAQCAEQCSDDRRLRLLLRRSTGGPYVLGPHRGECCWRPPV